MEKKKIFKAQPIRRFIGIQYMATGIFGYSFWEGKTEVVNISMQVLPRPDIDVDGFGKKLRHRHYDREMTLCPGARRDVIDVNGLVEGYFEYVDLDRFLIVTGQTRVRVHVWKDRWGIYQNSDLVAEVILLDVSERVRFAENGIDMEKRFLVHIFQKIDDSLYPYIMAISVLGF